MGLLDRVRVILRALEPKRTELDRVDAALARYRTKLDDYDATWPSGECCPACWFGRPYRELVEKIERTEAWRSILAEKLARKERSQ